MRNANRCVADIYGKTVNYYRKPVRVYLQNRIHKTPGNRDRTKFGRMTNIHRIGKFETPYLFRNCTEGIHN